MRNRFAKNNQRRIANRRDIKVTQTKASFRTDTSSWAIQMKVFVGILLVATCVPSMGAEPPARLQHQQQLMMEARQKWDSAAISNYSFVLEHICFCMRWELQGPALNKVSRQRLVSSTLVPIPHRSLRKIPNESPLRTTISELFKMIDKAIAGEYQTVEVSYDPILGFPNDISLNQVGLDDGGDSYVITEFSR